MGLFDKLLGRTWRKFQDKGDSLRDAGELGLALQEYRAAGSRFDGTDEEAAALEERIKGVRATLRKQHLERFEQLKGGEAVDRAHDALDSALSHSLTDAEKEEVEALRATISRGIKLKTPQRDDEDRLLPDEASAPGQEAFIALLGGLPEKQADHYEALGEPFRSGWIALHQGEIETALSKLEEALEAHPDDAYVQTELGRAHLAAGKGERAFELIDKAHAQRSDDVYIKLQLAQAGWMLKKFDVAEAALQAAHDLDEDNDVVLLAIGQHGLLSGDYASGIDAMEYLMGKARQVPPAFMRILGQLYEASGNLDGAVESYEAVLKAHWRLDEETGRLDFDPIAALSLARIYVTQKRKLDRAIDLLHAMLSITRGASAASMWTGIARAWQHKGDKAQAHKALEKARELVGSEDPELTAAIDKQLTELEAV